MAAVNACLMRTLVITWFTSRSSLHTSSQLATRAVATQKRKKPKPQTRYIPTEEPGLRLPIVSLLQSQDTFLQFVLPAKGRQPDTKKPQVLVEGEQFVREALQLGAKPRAFFFLDDRILTDFPLVNCTDATFYRVSSQAMMVASDLVTPPGIMATFDRPLEGATLQTRLDQYPITLICDNVSDPGNMGALIRSAAGMGCTQVIATKGSANVWSPKCVRGAAIAQFSIPLIDNVPWPAVQDYLPSNCTVYLADGDSSERKLHSFEYDEPNFNDSEALALVVGNEARGLSSGARELAFSHFGARLRVPISPPVESLNCVVAASVLLCEMRRQLVGLRGEDVA